MMNGAGGNSAAQDDDPGSAFRSTRDSAENWLKSEVGAWARKRLISEKQARLILARYGLIPGETIGIAKRRDLVFYVSILGALLVGVGIILVVAANWSTLPQIAPLLLLLAVTAGFYDAGYRSRACLWLGQSLHAGRLPRVRRLSLSGRADVPLL
jgi:uncharacterized membrane protein